MAVQKFILKREVPMTIKVGTSSKSWTSATGVLAGGIPGKIYDVAYGPVVLTSTLDAPAKIGSFVAGKGVIVNAPEYALRGGLIPSLDLAVGTVVSFMTAGHIYVTWADKTTILAGMNGRVLWQPKADGDMQNEDLCVIEVNGFK